MIEELHQMRPGICRMISLARSYMWWPNMDQDIQERVQKCNPCQINRKSPEKAPMHPWEYTSSPWIRIHIDYAGPFLGRMFLIVVDSYSKWKEIHISKDSTTKTTIEGLSKSFATHGFPE